MIQFFLNQIWCFILIHFHLQVPWTRGLGQVLVGLLSDNPTVGILALIWGVAYQQVENLTFEPRISAKAVDVHPAVAFGSVLMGAALFGVAGAFLAVPVSAMLLALLDIYTNRYELESERSSDSERAPPNASDTESVDAVT